jgi:UDP-2,3-diacylglucosamine hydrolase
MADKSKIYFISDVHLGARAFDDDREREKKLVRFLSSIQNDVKAIYFLGDIFDFWYEYKNIIPKGFTRLFGKLAELADAGVEMHYFIGNHDIWTGDYFEKEFGMIMHYDAEEMQINGKTFYLAHGHRTGYRPLAVKIMHFFFHSKWVRRIYNLIHPSINYYFGLGWSAHNRKYKHNSRR